jgi:hypothetical protein
MFVEVFCVRAATSDMFVGSSRWLDSSKSMELAGNAAVRHGTALRACTSKRCAEKNSGAGEGARTLDPDLGKVVLYH